MREHLGIHIASFKCEICEKQFTSKKTLEKHSEEFHNEEVKASFRCEICQLDCSNIWNLTQHVKTHNKIQDKTYVCTFCPDQKTFKYSRDLRRHNLSAHKIASEKYLKPRLKPVEHYSCDICGKVFGRKYFLDNHKASNICSTFPCPLCKLSLKSKEELVMHMEIPHNECDRCNFQTIYKKNYIRHCKRQHK